MLLTESEIMKYRGDLFCLERGMVFERNFIQIYKKDYDTYNLLNFNPKRDGVVLHTIFHFANVISIYDAFGHKFPLDNRLSEVTHHKCGYCGMESNIGFFPTPLGLPEFNPGYFINDTYLGFHCSLKCLLSQTYFLNYMEIIKNRLNK